MDPGSKQERGWAIMARTAPEFARKAQLVGLRLKSAYNLKEVARASSVSYESVCKDARENRLKTRLAPGREKGKLVEPEWFDEWWKEGIPDAE